MLKIRNLFLIIFLTIKKENIITTKYTVQVINQSHNIHSVVGDKAVTGFHKFHALHQFSYMRRVRICHLTNNCSPESLSKNPNCFSIDLTPRCSQVDKL